MAHIRNRRPANDPRLAQIFEHTFARVIELERELAKTTNNLNNMRATLTAIHTGLGHLLVPFTEESEVLIKLLLSPCLWH